MLMKMLRSRWNVQKKRSTKKLNLTSRRLAVGFVFLPVSLLAVRTAIENGFTSRASVISTLDFCLKNEDGISKSPWRSKAKPNTLKKNKNLKCS